jgi:hypothetical protein
MEEWMKMTEETEFAENSSRNVKQKTTTDPHLLFAKYNCEIIRETEDFLIAVPLDWECAVFFNSFDCGGKEVHWYIGCSGNAANWNNYLANKNVFFLIFFINEHPVYKRKVLIQYHVEDGKYTLWLQDNTKSNQIFSPLDTAIELIKNSAERLLGGICHKDYILKGSVLKRCYDRKSINIPTGVTAIGDHAFSWCESLAAITLPVGVTAIGLFAFEMCRSLTSIDIPNSVTTIGNQAFFKCESLTSINLPDSVTVIGYDVFSDCKNLRNITVGKRNPRFSGIDGVLFDKIENRILRYPAGKQDTRYAIPAGGLTIEERAFLGCENLVTIDIPDSVTTIEDLAFFNCKSLAAVNIPDSVSNIEEAAFVECENLKKIYLSRKITIDKYSFDDTTEIFYTD